MRGFSVSVLPVDLADLAARRRQRRLRPYRGAALGEVDLVDLPDGLAPIRPMPSAHAATQAFLTRCCEIMIAAEDDLNALDAKSGDGDTGSYPAWGRRGR